MRAKTLILFFAIASGISANAFAADANQVKINDFNWERALESCLKTSAQEYKLPPELLAAMLSVAGGHAEKDSKPDGRGEYTIGPMAIKSKDLPELANEWNLNIDAAHKTFRDNGCANVNAAAWLLRKNTTEFGTLRKGLREFESGSQQEKDNYVAAIMGAIYDQGLEKSFHESDLDAPQLADQESRLNSLKGCQLKPEAIACEAGPVDVIGARNAAKFYQTYGFNADLIRQSYTQAILKSSRCLSVDSVHDLKRVGGGKIATPSGWIEITELEIDQRAWFIVASDYLVGSCEKPHRRPMTSTGDVDVGGAVYGKSLDSRPDQ